MNIKMKRKLIAAIAISVVGLPAAHAASTPAGEAGKAPAATAGKTTAAQARHYARASKLIGSEVRNPQNEKLGKIEDLIVDTKSQTAHYAILSFGGIAGIGDKLFAYPVEMLQRTADKDELLLDIAPETTVPPGGIVFAWPHRTAPGTTMIDGAAAAWRDGELRIHRAGASVRMRLR